MLGKFRQIYNLPIITRIKPQSIPVSARHPHFPTPILKDRPDLRRADPLHAPGLCLRVALIDMQPVFPSFGLVLSGDVNAPIAAPPHRFGKSHIAAPRVHLGYHFRRERIQPVIGQIRIENGIVAGGRIRLIAHCKMKAIGIG